MNIKMANILVVDNQKWAVDICSKALTGTVHNISTTDDVKSVMQNVSMFKPDVVILNLYLKHGYSVWDVLLDIKIQDPNLPVLIFTAHDKHLYDSRLSHADGYVLGGCIAHEDAREKIAGALKQRQAQPGHA